MEINNEIAVADLTVLHEAYEHALVHNDIATLEEMFWDSPLAIRYGATENLYGIDEIKTFRRGRLKVDLARQVERLEITTFGDSLGVINLHFGRVVDAISRKGRQTQVWIKFAGGWKIVSAHVSFLDQAVPYVDAAAGKIGLPIRAEDRKLVEEEMQRISSIARVMLDFPLDQDVEMAPSFRP